MKKATLLSLLTIAVLIPGTLYLGTRLSGRWYYLTSTLVIIETMLPFFFAFESRRPQARELVILAVMAALAIAGRIAIPLPNFKATTAVIMITGIAFGPQAGFMTGAIAAFASNFFYSQGPWTPWQMMSYGMCGFVSGAVFYNRKLRFRNRPAVYSILLAVFGFASILFMAGPLLDCSTIFTTGSRISWSFVLAVFAAGLPHNTIHALACAATLLLLGNPLLDKLERLKIKYGILDGSERN